MSREVKIGVIELHSDPDLRRDFYMVTEDCRAAAQIVDVWMLDLRTIFARHGYTLTLTTDRPQSKQEG